MLNQKFLVKNFNICEQQNFIFYIKHKEKDSKLKLLSKKKKINEI